MSPFYNQYHTSSYYRGASVSCSGNGMGLPITTYSHSSSIDIVPSIYTFSTQGRGRVGSLKGVGGYDGTWGEVTVDHLDLLGSGGYHQDRSASLALSYDLVSSYWGIRDETVHIYSQQPILGLNPTTSLAAVQYVGEGYTEFERVRGFDFNTAHFSKGLQILQMLQMIDLALSQQDLPTSTEIDIPHIVEGGDDLASLLLASADLPEGSSEPVLGTELNDSSLLPPEIPQSVRPEIMPEVVLDTDLQEHSYHLSESTSSHLDHASGRTSQLTDVDKRWENPARFVFGEESPDPSSLFGGVVETVSAIDTPKTEKLHKLFHLMGEKLKVEGFPILADVGVAASNGIVLLSGTYEILEESVIGSARDVYILITNPRDYALDRTTDSLREEITDEVIAYLERSIDH